MTVVEEVNLFYKDAHSDKVYNAQLVEVNPGFFDVTFSYGRRGSVLTSGNKCQGCAEIIARKTYNKLD